MATAGPGGDPAEAPSSTALPAVAPASSGGRLRTFASLRDRNFRWFLSSIFAGFTSNDMQSFIRGWLVFELTGSFAMLGLMAFINGLSGLGLSLLGGVIADVARQRKYVVQLGQVIGGLNALVIGLLIAADALRIEHVLIAAAVHGGANNLTMPSRQALTPDVVGPERLMNAMGLYSTSQNAARLLMPGIAGWAVAAFGSEGSIGGAAYVYFFVAALFAVAYVSLIPVRIPDRPAGGRTVRSVLADLRNGFRHVAANRPLALLLACNPLLALLGLGYFLLLPGFAKEVLDAGAARLGLMTSVSGVGAVVGSLAVASFPDRRRGALMLASSVLLGISLVALAISTSYWVSVGIMLFAGVGQGGYLGFMNVLVQTLAGNEHRGRVMSIYMMEFNVMGLMLVGMGVAANEVGPRETVGVVGATLIALSLALIAWSPTLRRLD